MSGELKVEKPKAKKEPVSIKNIITKTIIVILALLMVGSAYYIVILLTADKNAEKSSYGSYDGEPILIEYNNVFYNSLMSNPSFQEAYLTGNYTNLWSSYYSGYQSQVLFIALSKMAAKAGISAPQELVNRAILETGVYNGEDGKFSVDVYNSTEAQTRSDSEAYMRSILPYQIVANDLCTAIVTAEEKQFVADLASDSRDLDYYFINYNAYPDKSAVYYANQNADLFKSADVTMIAFASEDLATTALESLKTGTKAEDLEDASISSKKASVNTIQAALTESSDIDKILALTVGSYSEPIETVGSYVIFRLDSEFVPADVTDADVLSEVKAYIYKTDAETVKPFIEDAKTNAAALSAEEFEEGAQKYGNGVISVIGVANNIGNSQFVSGANIVDSTGKLAEATADETVNKEIFTASQGVVCGPIAVDGGYLMVKVANTDTQNVMGSLINTLYDFYANQIPVNDITIAVLSSDKLKDNFTQQFLSTVLGDISTQN